MDTITVIALSIAVVSVGLAYLFFNSARGLGRTVDAARQRIGGSAPKRSWHRRGALDDALQRLERSTSQAQRERSQLAGAVQAAEIGIVITDDHGGVTFANQAAEQYLGARRGEPVADDRLRDAIEQAILNRAAVTIELESHTPLAQILEIGTVPLDFGVESIGAVAYIRDITSERRVDAVRRDFIANVGREIAAPLMGLAALSETIADSIDDPEVTRRLAVRLGAESTRLSAFVERILELSRVEALATQDHPVSAATLTESVVALVSDKAAEAGVELILETAASDTNVSGNEQQLRSMLVNLMDNAIRFSKPLTDSAPPRIWLRTAVGDSFVTFTVQDEGIGITHDHVDRIFERFYRVDQAEDGPADGPGVGLSIVRHIARNHGGEATVTSKPGEGSIFSVKLPMRE